MNKHDDIIPPFKDAVTLLGSDPLVTPQQFLCSVNFFATWQRFMFVILFDVLCLVCFPPSWQRLIREGTNFVLHNNVNDDIHIGVKAINDLRFGSDNPSPSFLSQKIFPFF